MMQKDLSQKKAKKDNRSSEFQKLMVKLVTQYGLEVPGLGINQFRFPVYITDRLKDESIEVLELSERGHNCLRRAGFHNVYDLFDKVSSMQDLKLIRNCGNGTAREIMEKIFVYQYNVLVPERRQKFVNRINEMNREYSRLPGDRINDAI